MKHSIEKHLMDLCQLQADKSDLIDQMNDILQKWTVLSKKIALLRHQIECANDKGKDAFEADKYCRQHKTK